MNIDRIQSEVEQRVAATEPDAEVLLCELSGERIRVFIDHPNGVDLDLCERVTRALRALRDDYSIEVSSPGPKRPLTKPAHFQRFLGSRAKIRTRSDHEGRRNFTGELVAADDAGVTIGSDGTLVTLAWSDISRSNLIP